MNSILVIGGQGQMSTELCRYLGERGYRVRSATGAEPGLALHRDGGADLVLALLPIEQGLGSSLLSGILAQDPRAVVVVAGRDASIRGAPSAIELGASDYLADPLKDLRELLSVVGVNLGVRRSDAQLRYLRRKDAAGADWPAIVGHCAAMRQVFSMVRQICHRTTAGGTPTILVTGETGTGKGLIAKAIHYNSVRRSRAFVALNCAAIPGTMMEAELFGHVRGAFTDARASRAGLFETADGGSLLLDEIGSLSSDLQGKLLTVIDEKSVRRLGSSESVNVDVQVIAATHRDLAGMVDTSDFRADLYHRLNVITVGLPPLRERGPDRILLAETFIRDMCREYGLAAKRLTAEAREAIEAYRWPGNVRELRNQIERIVLLHEGDAIGPELFQFSRTPRSTVAMSGGEQPSVSVSLPDDRCPLETLTGALEREVILRALDKNTGNVSRTARYLELSRQALIYRMRKYGLRAAEREETE